MRSSSTFHLQNTKILWVKFRKEGKSKLRSLWQTWLNKKGTILRIAWRKCPNRTWYFLTFLEEDFMLLTLASTKKDTKNSIKWKSTLFGSLNSMKTPRKTTFCYLKITKIFIISTLKLVTILSLKFKQKDKFVLMFTLEI
jgi:hypothetical protein